MSHWIEPLCLDYVKPNAAGGLYAFVSTYKEGHRGVSALAHCWD